MYLAGISIIGLMVGLLAIGADAAWPSPPKADQLWCESSNLIVKFAKERRESGMALTEAAVLGAHTRFRAS